MSHWKFIKDWIEEPNKAFTRALHEEKSVYGLYGLIDAPSVSYGVFKTLYSLWVDDDSDPHGFHNFITSPIGCAAAVIVTVPLIVCSYLGNTVDDGEKDAFLKYDISASTFSGDPNAAGALKDDTLHLCWDADSQSVIAIAKYKKTCVRFPIKANTLGAYSESITAKLQASGLHTWTEDERKVLLDATKQRDYVAVKHYLAVYWPFLRDVIKGLKNTFKGMTSTLQVGELLLGKDLHYFLLPTTLGLGLILAGVRLSLRSMKNQRKKEMDYNADLLMKIRNEQCKRDEFAVIRNKIEAQSHLSSVGWLFAAATGGMIDSLYLYVGILCLVATPWAPSLLIFLVACSALYGLICIATRVYEEYEYQRLLIETQVRVELEMLRREILELVNTISENPVASVEHWKNCQDILLDKLNAMVKQKEKLKKYSSFNSSFLITMYGLQSGLAVYGGVVSAALMAAMIVTLAGGAIPPIAVVICVALGLIFLAAFLIQAHVTFRCGENPTLPAESTQVYDTIQLGKNSLPNLNSGSLRIYLNQTGELCSEALKAGIPERLCIETLLGADADKIRKLILDAESEDVLSRTVLSKELQAQIFHVLAAKGYSPSFSSVEFINLVKRDNYSGDVIAVNQAIKNQSKSNIELALLTCMAMNNPPQLYTQSIAEIVRAGCSGTRQGQKVMGFIGAFWDADETRFLDMTTAEQSCLIFMACLYTGVLAVRADVRAFGKPKPGTVVVPNAVNDTVYLPRTTSIFSFPKSPGSPSKLIPTLAKSLSFFGTKDPGAALGASLVPYQSALL